MHRKFAISLAGTLVGLAGLWAAAAGEEFRPAAYPPGPPSYTKLASLVERHLREEVLAVWFPRCVDQQRGGFFPHFRADWSPGDRNDKTLVFQSRMTWVAAEVSRRLPDLGDSYRGYARHGMEFLEKTLWDAECGGFYWGLDATGRITPAYGDEKHVYGIAFAIYGLAAAHRATGERRPLELAQRTFRWLDEHAHDGQHGGYFEALTRDGKPILAPPAGTASQPGKRTDQLGTLYGFKSMNSHIHLLEALTALAEVWPEPLVQQRLREVFLIVRDRIAVRPGCLNLYFTPEWRPVPDHDSFGHDIETAYLLLEAAAVLGEPDEAATLTMARALVDHALEWGWDEPRGGFCDRGAAFAPAWNREKIWWTQAEGLNVLLLMHERCGGSARRYWDAFLKQWEFLWKYQIDHVHGEWYGSVSPEGTPKPDEAKATIWKAAYHNGRALLNVTERLRHLADSAGR